MWESCLSGSVRGWRQLRYGGNIVAPPGNQAANGENKLQPIAMEVLGLLDISPPSIPGIYRSPFHELVVDRELR